MRYDYKVGQEVIITGNTSGHCFKIGERVTILTADNEGSGSYSAIGRGELDWWFHRYECIPADYKSNQAAKDLLEQDY